MKKHLVLFFVGFGKVRFFFRILDVPIFNLNRLSYISLAKSVMCFFDFFFHDNKKNLGNNRFVNKVPKKTGERQIYYFCFGSYL